MIETVRPKSPEATLYLRERALYYGVAGFSDAELLAVLLGTGTEGEPVGRLAASLLDEVGGPRGLLRVGPHGLTLQRGVGTAKATRIAAALELGRRATLEPLETQRLLIHSFEAAAEWARPRLAHLDHEEVWLLGLDARNTLKSVRRIGQGGQHGCALTPRDILGPALRDAATSIVIIHNHPSGDSTPSAEDIAMTRALHTACEVIGLGLLDHIVVARGGATSLAALGALG
jgi:DNA repair protein RadC